MVQSITQNPSNNFSTLCGYTVSCYNAHVVIVLYQLSYEKGSKVEGSFVIASASVVEAGKTPPPVR
jgi:hypothetical protein